MLKRKWKEEAAATPLTGLAIGVKIQLSNWNLNASVPVVYWAHPNWGSRMIDRSEAVDARQGHFEN